MVIVPDSFEEQMMMAMAVSLAEVHATTTSAPTEVRTPNQRIESNEHRTQLKKKLEHVEEVKENLEAETERS
ncbi:hypothetical protein YC2023_017438 [Brassica napus]